MKPHYFLKSEHVLKPEHILAFCCFGLLAAAPLQAAEPEPATVKLTTTISGNQEQPKTIYILPWQTPVSVIRIPAATLPEVNASSSPLDRQQFLRFIAVQSATVSIQSTPESNQ
ncbi:hypothetical protein [Rheinheimera salexigens]|uniref:hypothetical protein n=1 Tax=Rheinheimera salexigens TaxID=1628148 RepID=UPI0009F5653E|nr:hypothetical protein [Rheinheimera salexigens]